MTFTEAIAAYIAARLAGLRDSGGPADPTRKDDTMTYNVDLMLQVRNQITAEPGTHDQDYYEKRTAPTACGTTRCIAGWAIRLATGKNVFGIGRLNVDAAFDRARDLLGLSAVEAHNLFFEFQDGLAIEKLDELIEKGKNQA